jgi:hypothetical protein
MPGITCSKDTRELTLDGKPIPLGHGLRIKIGANWSGVDLLGELVPERLTHIFALHPAKWIPTFYSLTNKDEYKLRYFQPKLIHLPAGTLIADMRYANQFYWKDQSPEFGKLYKASVRLLSEANMGDYHLPELLVPPDADS